LLAPSKGLHTQNEMVIQKHIFFIIISLFPIVIKSQDYCGFIQEIQEYQDSVKLRNSGDLNIIDSTTFNILEYLSFFNEIEIEEGIKIGVYFLDNFYDGNPYIYALRSKEKLIDKNKRALYKFLNQPESRAKNHIKPNDSEIGFLQYLFFYEMGEQFALKWHSNYNEKYIICSKKKLRNVINEFKKYNQPYSNKKEMEVPLFGGDTIQIKKLEKINPAIQLEVGNEHCTISWIENRTHKGIYRCIYKIQREAPHEIEMVSEEELLDISIGFIY